MVLGCPYSQEINFSKIGSLKIQSHGEFLGNAGPILPKSPWPVVGYILVSSR